MGRTYSELHGSSSGVVLPRSVKIARVHKHSSGSGHAVAVFLNGTLTYIQTLSKGGWKFEVKFAHSSNGLTCAARVLHMREVGTESIVSYDFHTKAAIVVLKERQVSQSCRVIPAHEMNDSCCTAAIPGIAKA
jgi:hypothetical protein